MRGLYAACASFAAVAATAAAFATAPALAGPDDDRSVETQAHIDAPKVFWNKEANSFVINSQAGGKTVPLDKTANWVGRGYNDDGSQNYVFPITDDPRLNFLGQDSQLLYMAPQVPGPGNSPIWSGFGADTAVPIENFLDGNFALELVGFNGPGEMNMFNYSTFGNLPVTRLFSSHDKVSRTVWLDPGTHTHNITTFTKPGRYEVTFDASARTTDGAFTASKPTTLVWRVGGTNPADEKLGDVTTAYNNAGNVSGTSSPNFTIAPHSGSENDGNYEEGYDEPTCPVDVVSGPGRRNLEVDREYCKGDEYTLKLTLEPQPRAAIGNTDRVDLGKVSSAGKTVETRFSEIGAGATPPPGNGGEEPGPGDGGTEPNPGERPEQPGPGDGNDGSDGDLLSTPVTISRGHVDLRAMDYKGEFSVALGDDSRQHATESVTRTIDSTTLAVTKLAKVKREGNVLADPSYDVLGPKGSELYVLPQAQQPGRVWPGFSSETLDRAKYPEGATMTLTPVSAPKGGKWFAYTENLGAIQKMYASSDKAADIPLPPGTHMHTAWAFTKPGTYTIDVTARAKQTNGGERSAGGEVQAKTQRLTFEVVQKSAGDGPGEVPGDGSGQDPSAPEAPDGESGDQGGTNPGVDAPKAPGGNPGGSGAEPGEESGEESGAEQQGADQGEDASAGATGASGGDVSGAANSSGGTESGGGGTLPRTGATLLPLGMAAGVLVGGGAVLVAAGRRRG